MSCLQHSSPPPPRPSSRSLADKIRPAKIWLPLRGWEKRGGLHANSPLPSPPPPSPPTPHTWPNNYECVPHADSQEILPRSQIIYESDLTTITCCLPACSSWAWRGPAIDSVKPGNTPRYILTQDNSRCSSLCILSAVKEDGGEYYCTCTTGSGETMGPAYLFVYRKLRNSLSASSNYSMSAMFKILTDHCALS